MADVLIPNNQWHVQGRVVSATKITPHDTEKRQYDALFIIDGGAVKLQLKDDAAAMTDAIAGLPANTLLPFATEKVLSTGTTATKIYGLRVSLY